MKWLAGGLLLMALATDAVAETKPNIVFILADDLGYGDLGCYGQQKIRTPNIDKLATEGMRFTAHYAGNNVCAPSRCVLMTGLHPGHTFVRTNRQAAGFDEGQTPVPPTTLTLPLTLKKLEYRIGGFGKWGLGPIGSTGEPMQQGFDRFFGYNCQGVAHNFYPASLWDNERRVPLDNPPFSPHQKLAPNADPNNPASYAQFTGKQYAPDVIGEQARQFVRANKDRPFFLYYPTTVPHLALQVPEDSLAEYSGQFSDRPYTGDRRYLPHRSPHAAYAAMVTRMDRDVGRLVALVSELGLDERTIFVFTSDNGAVVDELGGSDTPFFNSTGGLRGRKGSFYEGGFRVPCIVRWKSRIAPSTTSDRVTGFEDWLPTLLEMVGTPAGVLPRVDGISFAPTLLGRAQEPRPFLYRESPTGGGQQSVRVDNWKGLRLELNPGPNAKLAPEPLQLFDLATDPTETTDVASKHPDVVEKLLRILREQHVKSQEFPIRALDES